MKTLNVTSLLRKARKEGAVLRIERDGGVLLDAPPGFPAALVSELRQHREDVEAALRDEAEFETALRAWFPKLGETVVDRATGRTGQVWGATRYGLIVDFGPAAPLLTLDPRDGST